MLVDALPVWGVGYVLGNVVAAGLATALAYYAWHHRTEPGAKSLLCIMTGAAIWCSMVALHVLSEPVWLTHTFVRVMFVGIALVVVGSFTFGLEFTGREQYLTRRSLGLLAVHPVGMVLIVLFKPEYMWTSVEAAKDPTNITGISTEWGPAFDVHILYTYLLITTAFIFLIEHILREDSVYRWQGLAVLVGAASVMVGNLAHLLGLAPVDLASIGYVIDGLAFGWAIFSYKLMDISPVARGQIVDEIDDAMFVLDREERFTDLNPAAERLLDVDRETALGEHAETIFSEYPEVYDRYRDVERTRDEVDIQVGDELRSFEIRVSPLYDSHDRLVARQFLLHDSTHQRRRQQTLEHRNEQLERFAGVVSHDLRNPINVARGYVDVAQETGDVEPLEEVEQSFDRMEAIIEDVLTMAREGQEMNDPEPVNLETVTREAWQHVDTGASTLDIAGTMTFNADRDKLQRLIENLLRNAREHVGGELTITVGPIGTGDGSALIDRDDVGFYVADDGPGIPEEEREAVLDAGYTTAEDGTGLGLSIVQSIAQSHGWTVDITDSAAGGTRIELTGVVPIENGARPESPEAQPVEAE